LLKYTYGYKTHKKLKYSSMQALCFFNSFATIDVMVRGLIDRQFLLGIRATH